MKENSSIWDLLAKRTDHSLSKEEVEALEQMLKEDTSLQRASQLVDDSLVNMDTRQVEEVMNRTWSKVESGMKANRKPRLKLIIRRCAVAASIAVLCVLGGVLGYHNIRLPISFFISESPNRFHPVAVDNEWE